MKKLLFVALSVLLLQSVAKSQTKQDSLSIKETVANYIEGWYSADVSRMEKSLHKDLAKRGIVPSRDGKNTEMLKASYTEMVSWTGQKPNQLKGNDALKNQLKISITEIGINIASAKSISPEFIDYLHLAKIGNEWKILNAIWEPNYKAMGK